MCIHGRKRAEHQQEGDEHVCGRELSRLEKGGGLAQRTVAAAVVCLSRDPSRTPVLPTTAPLTEGKLLMAHHTCRCGRPLTADDAGPQRAGALVPTVLVSGTGFMENSFSTGGGGGVMASG